jgi:glucose-1-phosphate adenylyltransferase
VNSTVENSIIGIGTSMRSAVVRNSLVMGIDLDPDEMGIEPGNAGIGEGTVIENAIIDKNASIGKNVQILGSGRKAEAEGPGWVVRDGVVVVTRNAEIPDGTVI